GLVGPELACGTIAVVQDAWSALLGEEILNKRGAPIPVVSGLQFVDRPIRMGPRNIDTIAVGVLIGETRPYQPEVVRLIGESARAHPPNGESLSVKAAFPRD